MTNDSISSGVSTSAIADAKKCLTITALWARLGLSGEVRLRKKCRSPFREDRSPSFEVSVDPSGGLEKWRDWSTGEHGDALDFLARARGLTIKEARPEFLALANGERRDASDATVSFRCTKSRERAAKARNDRRRVHPANFRFGTKAELVALSKLRSVSVEGLQLASDSGVLRFGDFNKQLCWTVLDETMRLAQSRRLDGERFDGGRKSHTWKGCEQAWPLNCHSLGTHDKVALVEGGPDMLAAFGYACAEGKEASVAIVGMLGAGCSIPDDALPLFKGKHARLFPHAEIAGQRAGVKWWKQLESVEGVTLDWFVFDSAWKQEETELPVNDLNDLCCISYNDFERDRTTWEALP